MILRSRRLLPALCALIGCTLPAATEDSTASKAIKVIEEQRLSPTSDLQGLSHNAYHQKPLIDGHHISLIQLIVNPEKFDGQMVVVDGFFQTGMEQSELYLSKDDAQHVIKTNSVHVILDNDHLCIQSWVPTDDSISKACVNRKYVMVQGTFQKRALLTEEQSGTLTHVTRIMELMP